MSTCQKPPLRARGEPTCGEAGLWAAWEISCCLLSGAPLDFLPAAHPLPAPSQPPQDLSRQLRTAAEAALVPGHAHQLLVLYEAQAHQRKGGCLSLKEWVARERGPGQQVSGEEAGGGPQGTANFLTPGMEDCARLCMHECLCTHVPVCMRVRSACSG